MFTCKNVPSEAFMMLAWEMYLTPVSSAVCYREKVPVRLQLRLVESNLMHCCDQFPVIQESESKCVLRDPVWIQRCSSRSDTAWKAVTGSHLNPLTCETFLL